VVEVDLDLRPERRHGVVLRLASAFEQAVDESRVHLRGSLATGTADRYSDIDLGWFVPDGAIGSAIDAVSQAVRRAYRVERIRIDPDFARSDRRRTVFIRLTDLPLFWRIDLDIRTQSIASDEYDVDNPLARSEDGWSRPASAIENAVAALKAVMRNQPDKAAELLMCGFDRIQSAWEGPESLPSAIIDLASQCAFQQPDLGSMAAQLEEAILALVPGD